MAKYLDENGLVHLWDKIKEKFLTSIGWSSNAITQTKNGSTTTVHTFHAVATSGSYSDLSGTPSIPTASTSNPAMDGTASAGTSTSWSRGDHVHPTDTSRAASSHTHGSITNGGAITSDTAVSSGDKLIISDSSDSSKLKRSGVAFGSDTTKYLRNDGTWEAPVGTTYDQLYLAEVIAGTGTTPKLVTAQLIHTYVTSVAAGSLNYRGTATSDSDLGTAYKKGWYWIVGSAGGTIAGQTVEAGDMVLAHADYSGTVADDVDIVQSNIDLKAITNAEIDTIVAA